MRRIVGAHGGGNCAGSCRPERDGRLGKRQDRDRGRDRHGGIPPATAARRPRRSSLTHRTLLSTSEATLNIADAYNQRVREILNTPPTASFSVSETSGRAPLTVSFDASASSDPDGQITKCVWEFGDGSTAGGGKRSHTYTRAGTYTAKLTVTDDAGATSTDSRTITVTVAVKPRLSVSGFSVSKAQAGKSLTVSFTVKSNGKGVTGSLSCSVKLDGKPLTASHHSGSSSGVAACTWSLSRSSSGERLASSISESYKGARVSRSFSVKVS